MRRWNGWGDDSIETILPPRARDLLESLIGPGTPPRDATLDDVAAVIPPSRLAAEPALDADPLARVRHARGQSLSDWVALRFGRLDAVPDAIARPVGSSDVAAVFALAARAGAALIPYGGGTSVVGGAPCAPPSDRSSPWISPEWRASEPWMRRAVSRRSGRGRWGLPWRPPWRRTG